MQAFVVVALFLLILLFGLSKEMQSTPLSQESRKQSLADFVAGNLIQFNNLAAQYVRANYSSLHKLSAQNIGQVEQLNVIDSAQYAIYDQKNVRYLLDYKTVVFNYTQAGNDLQTMPTLYLVTTWSSFVASATTSEINFLGTNLDEVMGKVNQITTHKLYQANSTYWTIPWAASQTDCSMVNLYTQLPDAASLPAISAFFNNFCNYVQANSNFIFGKYVYVQAIYPLRAR